MPLLTFYYSNYLTSVVLFYGCLPIKIQITKNQVYCYFPLHFQRTYLLNKFQQVFVK